MTWYLPMVCITRPGTDHMFRMKEHVVRPQVLLCGTCGLSPSHAAPAVDFQASPRDECRLVGGEKHRGVGDVERLRHAAHRDGCHELPAILGRVGDAHE